MQLFGPVALALAGATLWAYLASAQTMEPVNQAPNPYVGSPFGKLPEGRLWGATAGIGTDKDGTSIWVFDRCGTAALPGQAKPGEPFACDGSEVAPILKFDSAGNLVTAFGAGMFVFPHGLHVDFEGNIWVTDGMGRGNKGQQVFKFSPDGKVLMTLGRAGVGGSGNDEFNAPSAVYVAPQNGDIFVADGHGGNSNARIVKFDKNGNFIKTWGHKGSGPGEMDIPHALAMDSEGRLFLADRQNNRIEIFDQDGNFLDQWQQFSRPSGIYIDKNDILYVADSESGSVAKNHDGWRRGIRLGRVSDGVVTAFIPDPVEKATTTSAAEGVTADMNGAIYGAEAGPRRVMRYLKK